jgi:phospholipid/cholesterol/gamma-HCH transport system substrate-binding protein
VNEEEMTAPRHDFSASEIKAGALVLISLAVLVFFIAAVRGCGLPGEATSRFHTTFTNTAGLNRGAEVRFGGVKVGRVVVIASDPDDRARIRVTAELRSNVPVNEGSVASIEQVTLTSEKHLEISTGDAGSPLLASGAQLPSRDGGDFFGIPNLAGVIAKLELLLDGVVTLLGVEGADEGAGDVDVPQLLADLQLALNESTGTLHELRGVISDNRTGLQEVVTKLVALEEVAIELVGQFNGLVAENREALSGTATNLESLTAEARTQVDELAASLQVALRHLQDVGGNTSDLVEGERATIEQILRDLQATTHNLSEFSRILAEQPQALVRGKKARGRSSEEGQ